MFKAITTLTFFITSLFLSMSQLPSKVLVGYWHTWQQSDVPFIELGDIDDRYNVVCLSFAGATNNNVNNLSFGLAIGNSSYNTTKLKTDIQTLQNSGKTILMSVGGANGSFKLNSIANKNTFVSKMKTIISEYGVDGIDIDLEQTTNVCTSSGSFSNPENHIQYLIDGIEELMTWYQTKYSKKMILTTAPETVYIQGGLSPWNSCGGALLPFIEQLRDDLDLVMVQLYNSGGMYGLDGVNGAVFENGTQSFITSQTEAVIRGFTIAHSSLSGTYSGLPASKVVIALPANNCQIAAFSGFISPDDLIPAIKYLNGSGNKVGTYTLKQSGGYPELRGMMTWSINNDNVGGCGSAKNEYANTFESVFGLISNTEELENIESSFVVYPNPTQSELTIESTLGKTVELYNTQGELVLTTSIQNPKENITLTNLSKGVYLLKLNGQTEKIIVE